MPNPNWENTFQDGQTFEPRVIDRLKQLGSSGVQSVSAADSSITIGGTASDPTIAVAAGATSSVALSTVTISASGMKSLTTVGQQLVPATTNTLIVPLSVTLELVFATTPYADASSSDVEIVTGADPFAAPGWFAISSAAVTAVVTAAESVVSSLPILPSNVTPGSPALDHSPVTQTFGQSLWLVNFGAELASGDSPIKITTIYGAIAG